MNIEYILLFLSCLILFSLFTVRNRIFSFYFLIIITAIYQATIFSGWYHKSTALLSFVLDSFVTNYILVLSFISLSRKYSGIKENWHLLIFCIYCIIAVFLSQNHVIALGEARFFVLPMLLLYTLRLRPISNSIQFVTRLTVINSLSVIPIAFLLLKDLGKQTTYKGINLIAGYEIPATIGFISLIMTFESYSFIKNKYSVINFLATILSITIIVLSGAKRWYLICIISMIYAIYQYIKIQKQILLIIKWIVRILIVGSIVFIASYEIPPLSNTISKMTYVISKGKESVKQTGGIVSASGRISKDGDFKKGVMYQFYSLILKRPLGYGWGNIGMEGLNHKSKLVAFDGIFQQIGYAIGIPGLTIFLILIIVEFKNIHQHYLTRQMYGIGLKILIISFVLDSIVGGPVFSRLYMINFVGLLACVSQKKNKVLSNSTINAESITYSKNTHKE